jgi:hypothetical protein
MKRHAPFEITTPMVRQHGWPDADGELVMSPVVSQTRRRRVAAAFVARMAR